MSNIVEIFERCMNGTATAADQNALFAWMEHPDNRMEAVKLLEGAFMSSDGSLKIEDRKMEGMVQAILDAGKDRIDEIHRDHASVNEIEGKRVGNVYYLRKATVKWIAAAVIILVAGAIIWQKPTRGPVVAQAPRELHQDIEPGRSGAVLTLADGSKVSLDSSKNGVIAMQNGAQVLLQNGQLTYDLTGSSEQVVAYNTMTTPKGMQYNLVLPDGTRIWLNAASSIRYPTVFEGSERRVEVTGEAYFEVAHNPAQPFFVKINGQTEVQVLGTYFNVNAYDDEDMVKTTLIKGSVRVVNNGLVSEGAVLKPGQQAQISRSTEKAPAKIVIVANADVDKALAWKNGVFDFDGANLEEVMKQLARWYNIEVIYENGIPQKEFIGKMSKEISLSGLLRGLEDAEVHFRIEEGRRLVVLH